MAKLNLLLIGTWHRRCGVPYYYSRALRQLGNHVVTAGPWRTEEPFGTDGREPDFDTRFENLVLDGKPDAVIVASGGEGLRLPESLIGLPFAHIDSEGAGMEWSRSLTPYRYAEIMCNNCDDGVSWLPKAFDVEEHFPPTYDRDAREYDIVQLASARDSRKWLWATMRREHPDINCVFGDMWGSLYGQAYRHALTTWVCSTIDFVTTRVFEAMAMGCIVLSDLTPSIQSLFMRDVHFIGFERVMRSDGEGLPDAHWLAETVRDLWKYPAVASRIRKAALEAVWSRGVHGLPVHSYQARMARVLCEMGLCRERHIEAGA